MIKCRQEIFITLVTLCSISAEARYYSPQFMLRGENAQVLDILLRGNGNLEISTLLSDSPKSIGIGNLTVDATHRDDPKPALFGGGYPKTGNAAVTTIHRNNPRAFFRDGDPEISAIVRDNPKPFLVIVIPEVPATSRKKPKSVQLAGIPEILATLREYKFLNSPLLRIGKHSDTKNYLVPTSGINKYTIKDNGLKVTFNKMIEAVAKENGERIRNLKKLFELENHLPRASRSLEQKNPLIAILIKTPNYKPKYDNLNTKHLTEPQYEIVKKNSKEPSMLNTVKEIIEGTHLKYINDDDDEVNTSQESDDTMTKRHYLRGWKGCKKSALKYCIKACKKAFETVCSDYQCNRGLKKDGKKKCKQKCKNEFGSGDYDSD